MSVIPVGASTSRKRSRKLCLKEWTTQLSGTNGRSHLFKVALAEFELRRLTSVYLGKAKSLSLLDKIREQAQKLHPTRGIRRLLFPVLRGRHL